MKTYQVIAKKFRPQKFCEVFEQDAIIQTLKNAIRLERMGHAYLFCGTRGTGKTTLARLLAKAINCENLSQDQEPCNICCSCKEITSGHSLDVIEIDGASNRGIDDIRNLNETVGYAASNGRYKVYIIDEVHMLTKEAFNALLKTLEEPPEHVLFFFATTEAHKVLPTIISRCQRFDLKRITPEKIQAKLKTISQQLKIEIEEEALHLISDYAEGSMRDAESLLDQLICYENPPITKEHAVKSLGLLPSKLFFNLDEAAGKSHLPFAFELTEKVFKMGCHLGHFLESLIEHYRNIALVQMGKKGSPEYEQSAQHYSREQILEILDYLLEMQEKTQRSPFKQIHLEIILLRILRSKNKISIEALVNRLEKLKEASEIKSIEKPLLQVEDTKDVEDIKDHVEEVPFFPPEPSKPIQESQPIDIKKKIKHERVMRFTSVELNGSIR
jgi:DNA polymerase III subunit gamma/tau